MNVENGNEATQFHFFKTNNSGCYPVTEKRRKTKTGKRQVALCLYTDEGEQFKQGHESLRFLKKFHSHGLMPLIQALHSSLDLTARKYLIHVQAVQSFKPPKSATVPSSYIYISFQLQNIWIKVQSRKRNFIQVNQPRSIIFPEA